jgi:urocanate hydratase
MEGSKRVSAKTPAVAEQIALLIAYEIFSEASKRYFGGTLTGKFVAGCGMGKSGGTQALAAPMNGAAFLGIDANPETIKQRVKSGYCDVMVNDLDEALRILKNAVRTREATSVGLVGNCADVIPAMAKRGAVPDLLVDQTTAHTSSAAQTEGLLELERLGSKVFGWPDSPGTRVPRENTAKIGDAFAEFIRPRLAQGFAAIYCTGSTGQTADIRRIDLVIVELFPQDEPLARWTGLVQKRTRFQNPPARAYWLSREQRTQLNEAIVELAARGEFESGITVDEYHFNSVP